MKSPQNQENNCWKIFTVEPSESLGDYSYRNYAAEPYITTQPQSTTAREGQAATFSVVARIFSGSTPLYQWQVSTDNGASYSVISGATSSSYTIASVSTNKNNERYRVVVSASGGTSLISSAATLIVYSQTAIEYLVVGGGSGVVILVSAVPLASVSAGLTYTVDTTSRPGLFVYRFTAGSGTVSR